MSMLVSVGQKLTPKNVTLGVILTNMVCRPTITLSNKGIPEETRKYTATREFFTEFFGALTTFTFATFIGENLVPKLAAKKWGVNLTKELAEKISKTEWSNLTNPIHKNIKATKILSSFATTAIAVAVLTPLLNNLVLNKLMEKIWGKSKKPETPINPSGPLLAGKINPANNTAGTPRSAAFENFLNIKLQNNSSTLNKMG
jgi:hypothetical protein